MTERRTFDVIPVPVGWSAEQAWEAISRGDELQHPDGEPSWVVVETHDGRFVGLLDEPTSRGRP